MAIELNETNFDDEIQSPIMLVDFWAPWCGPCKMMEPVLQKLEKKFAGEVRFGKINVDHHQDIAKKYSVMGLPSYVLFKNGKGVEKVTGVYSVEKLAHYLQRKLAE